jgi:hypothetical protein
VVKARGKQSIMIVVAQADQEDGAENLNQRIGAAGCPF